MLMVRMQVHIPPEAHAALQKRAHEEGVSASELVRQGIELRLERGADAAVPAPGVGSALSIPPGRAATGGQ